MKPGYKTSEFAAALTIIVGSFASVGLISQQDIEPVVQLLEAAIGFLTAAFIAYQYIKGRNNLKQTLIETQGPTVTTEEKETVNESI